MRLIALLLVVLIMGVLAVVMLPGGGADPDDTILCLGGDGGMYDSSREKGCRVGDRVLDPT